MYSLNKPVAELRTKMRQEFERHRYVSQLQVVDMLIFQSNAEFQVRYNIPYPFQLKEESCQSDMVHQGGGCGYCVDDTLSPD